MQAEGVAGVGEVNHPHAEQGLTQNASLTGVYASMADPTHPDLNSNWDTFLCNRSNWVASSAHISDSQKHYHIYGAK